MRRNGGRGAGWQVRRRWPGLVMSGGLGRTGKRCFIECLSSKFGGWCGRDAPIGMPGGSGEPSRGAHPGRGPGRKGDGRGRIPVSSLDAGRCLSRGRLPPPSAVHNSVPALTRAFVRCSPTVLSFSRARHVSPLDAYQLEYPTVFQPSRDSIRLTTAS